MRACDGAALIERNAAARKTCNENTINIGAGERPSDGTWWAPW